MSKDQTPASDKALDALIQRLGDICHEQYMGCVKARDTGNTNVDFDYCYTDEVVNMLDRPEAREAIRQHIAAELLKPVPLEGGTEYVFVASREALEQHITDEVTKQLTEHESEWDRVADRRAVEARLDLLQELSPRSHFEYGYSVWEGFTLSDSEVTERIEELENQLAKLDTERQP